MTASVSLIEDASYHSVLTKISTNAASFWIGSASKFQHDDHDHAEHAQDNDLHAAIELFSHSDTLNDGRLFSDEAEWGYAGIAQRGVHHEQMELSVNSDEDAVDHSLADVDLVFTEIAETGTESEQLDDSRVGHGVRIQLNARTGG